MADSTPRMTTAPGWGERRALGGYVPQYLTTVYLVVRALIDESLDEVRLADLEAGRVDDLLLLSHEGFLDAFQMKTEEREITYADFAGQQDGIGLLRDLADGWKRLTAIHPGRVVRIHFLTKQHPSQSRHGNIFLPVDHSPPPLQSFKAFLHEAFFPYQEALRHGKDFDFPSAWQPAFEHWLQATGLSLHEFTSFIRELDLSFDYSFPTFEEIAIFATHRDITSLYYFFQQQVAKAKQADRPISISRQALKQELGRERFEQRNIHGFSVTDWYTPIVSSVSTLRTALDAVDSGYLAVVGSPGSGKSSLLTRTVVEAPSSMRVVAYYAYVPDETGSASPPRGEAVNFLQDITQQLERYGFSSNERLPELDPDKLRNRLAIQLQHLGQDYQVSGCKTVIVVDGLDHIAREQTDRIHSPLWAELPFPSQLPPGVVFVLGSQHVSDLPEAIKSQLREPRRTISIHPLAREQVYQVLKHSGVLDVAQRGMASEHYDRTAAFLQAAYGMTQGHPLALAYLINQLMDAAKRGESLLSVVEQAIPYDGNIHDQYETHWQLIDREVRVELRDLVGLVARMRGGIDFQWMRQTWPERRAVQLLESRFGHFFKRDRHGRWQFFHNSFRQYLLSRSVETIDGSDPMEEIRFHKILAERSRTAIDRPLAHWDTLFHLWKAEQYDSALDLATRDFFEQQLLALRPPQEVIGDAQLAVIAAARMHDAVRMFKALFVWSECKQRGYELVSHDEKLLEMLIAHGDVDAALRWILDGQSLRVRDNLLSTEGIERQGLSLSARLGEAGFVDQGREVFDLAEPLHLLRSGSPLVTEWRQEAVEVLVAWVRAAPYFRTVDDIVAHIRSLRFAAYTSDEGGREEQITQAWQNRLLAILGKELAELGRADNISSLIRGLDVQESLADRELAYRMNHILCWKAYDADNREDAKRQVTQALSLLQLCDWNSRLSALRAAMEDVDISTRLPEATRSKNELRAIQDLLISVARDVIVIGGDANLASEWLGEVRWSELHRNSRPSETVLDATSTEFVLYSLLYAMEKPLPSVGDVTDEEWKRENGLRRLLQIAFILARLRGQRWQKRPYNGQEFREVASAVLNCRYPSVGERRYALYDEELFRLIDWLLEEAVRWGSEATGAVQELLGNAWQSPDTRDSWPNDVKRQIALRLFEHEDTREWAAAELTSMLGHGMPEADNDSYIVEVLERARIALLLGKNKESRELVQQSIRACFRIGYSKDYQLDAWVEWLGRWNELDPGKEAMRIQTYAQRTIALDRALSEAASYVARRLLKVTRQWNASRAVELFWWFFDRKCLGYFPAVEDWIVWCLDQVEQGATRELGPGIALMCALHLPWLTTDDEGTILAHAVNLVSTQDTENLRRRLDRIVCIVSTEAPGEVREAALNRVIETAATQGVEIFVPRSSGGGKNSTNVSAQSPQHEHALTLADGKTLTLAEVVAQLRHDYHSMRVLVSNEQITGRSNNRFNWAKVVAAIAPQLHTEDALEEVAREAVKLEGHQVVLPLAERAAEIGCARVAEELALLTLSRATAQGWSRRWDGGSKQRPFAILTRIDPMKYRQEAFDAFALDLEKGDGALSAIDALNELVDLFPIFAVQSQELDVCLLVEEHVAELFKTTYVSSETLDFFHVPSLTSSASGSGTLQFLLSHLLLPINELRVRVIRSLTELFLECPSLTIPHMQAAFHGNEDIQEQLLAICEAVALNRPHLLVSLLETVHSLVSSNHFGISQTAQRILLLCGDTGHRQTTVVSALIPIRDLSIAVPFDELDEFAGHSLIASPGSRLGPFALHARVVAQLAGVDEREALYLCARLLDQFGATTDALRREEEALRSRLEQVRLPYMKAQASAARRVVNHFAMRLQRQGLLSDDDLEWLGRSYLTRFDPSMILWYPSPRPADVGPMENADRMTAVEWAERLDRVEGPSICPIQDLDGNVILGEHILLESDYHRRWERRYTTIAHVESDELGLIPTSNFYDSITGGQEAYYKDARCLSKRYKSPRILVQAIGYWLETRGLDWLSICPDIAREMLWQPSVNPALSWETPEGELVVKSFGWQDGTARPYQLHYEFGYGWRVVVTADGWRALKSVLQQSVWRVIEVQRGSQGNRNAEAVKRWTEPL